MFLNSNFKGEEEKKMWLPIVFAVTDNYIKYLSVTIQSINENSPESKLWIYVFHTNVTESNQKHLCKMQNERIKIEFINVEGKFDEKMLFVDGHVTKETYFRLLIPELLPQWERVLYMDCDLICLNSIEELYQTDIGENWIAGVITTGNEKRSEYTIKHLGIPSQNYINAGVLIVNNKELNKIEWRRMWTQCLKEKGYFKWHDQDVLNMLCFEKIYFLEPKWNTTVLRIKHMEGYDSEKEIEKDKLNCNIIHYASVKPWKGELCEVNLPFWRYAYNTPFITDIISEYEKISNCKKHFTNLCEEGRISFELLFKCIVLSIKARLKNKTR